MVLSALSKRRREHVKSCVENKDRSHKIIASLYSDPSRFVYEILQNADDAAASEIRFILSEEKLKIVHDGYKEFDYSDVESITTIGSSTKRDDINAIGKFGAGFKSVFAVTQTPQINSGKYHFKILDFIIPEQIPNIVTDSRTIISLPFNHKTLSPGEAYEQISARLRSLDAESLLFMNNIKEIIWETVDDSGHYIAEILSDRAYIVSIYNGIEVSNEYICFNRHIKIDHKDIKLSIAYFIDDKTNKIIPLNDTKLFVYFPTNERTGLKFFVHAPYKTTPSRETIPFEDQQNEILTEELSDLVSESITEIKKMGYLDVGFLNMLPLDEDEDHPLYKEIFDKVRMTLSREELLPTNIPDVYSTASQSLLARGKEITRLLGIEDTKKMFNREYWLNTDITYDRTRELRDYLIEKLNIKEIEISDFAKSITKSFIIDKSDEWLIDFYSSIIDSSALYRKQTGILRQKPIIRLDNGNHINPDNIHNELQVYLPTEQESGFLTVKKTFLKYEISKEFLVKLGLKEPDKIAEIKEFIVPKYGAIELKITQNEYIKDFNNVFSIWMNSDSHEKIAIENLLKMIKFIGAVNYNEIFSIEKAQNVYFLNEKLRIWFEDNEEDQFYFLSDFLQNNLIKFNKFIEKLGVNSEPKMFGIKQYGGWGKWDSDRKCYAKGLKGFNPEFYIEGLNFSLKEINLKRSLYIFDFALKFYNKLLGIVEESSRQGFDGGYHHEKKEELSIAGKLLRENRWLYDKYENLINATNYEITIEDLSEKYDEYDENVDKLIKAIGLKLDEIKAVEEKTGGKFISKEELPDYEEFQRQKKGKDINLTPKNTWSPQSSAEDVEINIDESPINTIQTEDLSNQIVTTKSENQTNNDNSSKSKENAKSKSTSQNSREIGFWGEKYAEKYLNKKYYGFEVVWLNQSGNIGKGYDFVIKNQDQEEIFYYEVKTKVDETPSFFEITGTQWDWARELYIKDKGDKYIILLVSNAGTENARIREFKNPVNLWKSRKIYAHPVNIEL